MAMAEDTVEEIEEGYRRKPGRVAKTIMYEEQLLLFERGFVDEEVFRNTIAEIDLLRKTYNRDTNDVMQAIMKALIVLPTKIIHSKRNFPMFKAKLDEVLRRFQVLVLHFKKKKDAYKNYLRGLRLGVDVLIAKEYVTMGTELKSVLGSVKEETDWAFNEIIDDLIAGFYGSEFGVDDNDDVTPAKGIILHTRQPAMYDDMNFTEDMNITEDADSDMEMSDSDIELSEGDRDDARVPDLAPHVVLPLEESLERIQEEPWQSALRSCFTILTSDMLDLNSIMDLLIQERLLTIDMQEEITVAHPHSNFCRTDGTRPNNILRRTDRACPNNNLRRANSDSNLQLASWDLFGSDLPFTNRDHPDKNRELLKYILRKHSSDGRACFCVFIKGLVNSEQGHLVTLIAEGLHIAWVQHDYIIDIGLGTTSTQLRDYLVNLETILLRCAPDSSNDVTLTSPTQAVIHDTWRTEKLTKDQVTALLNKAFPLHKYFKPSIVRDERGERCYLYENVQRRDDVELHVGVQVTL